MKFTDTSCADQADPMFFRFRLLREILDIGRRNAGDLFGGAEAVLVLVLITHVVVPLMSWCLRTHFVPTVFDRACSFAAAQFDLVHQFCRRLIGFLNPFHDLGGIR